MHEQKISVSWLRDDTEGKAEEVEELNRKAEQDKVKVESGSWRGKKEIVAVVCKMYLLLVTGRVFEKSVEEDGVNLLEDESENWC